MYDKENKIIIIYNWDLLTVKLTKPWTPEIFMECYYVAINKPISRGTQREYSSKPLKHSIVKCILVLKRLDIGIFLSPKNFHLFGFPSWKSSDQKIIRIKTYFFKNFSQKKGSRKF